MQSASIAQCQELSATLLVEHHDLKASELLLFLHRFKAGAYGKFYNVFDPLVITDAIRTFRRERAEAHEQNQRAEQAREFEQAKQHSVTYQQYLQLKERAEQGDAEAIKQLTP